MKMPSFDRRRFLSTSLAAAAGACLANRAARQAWAQPVWEDNETVVKAREQALAILKPSQRDLEHALELHSQSLVFDSYGFAPRTAIDGDRLRAYIESGASDLEVDRLRSDMMMTRCATDPVERAEFLQAFKAAGVTCIFQNAGEEGHDPLKMLERLARFTYVTDMMKDVIVKAVTPDEIEAAFRQGKRALYLTTNGVPITQQWLTVSDELRFVRIFYQLGVRMMHTTYNRRNMIGDGCGEPTNGGLSDFGREAVAEMNRVGVIVDVAHSGWQTSFDAAKVSSKPMVASHSTVDALHHHIRAKPVDVIQAIADTGGYIGICCIPHFLGGRGGIDRLLDHIDYVVQRFGPDHVAIGTDIAYQSRQYAAEAKKLPSRPGPRQRADFQKLWPDDPNRAPSYPDSGSIAWVNWPMFTVGMVQRGYKDEDIQKILGGNVMRVCRENLPAEDVRTG